MPSIAEPSPLKAAVRLGALGAAVTALGLAGLLAVSSRGGSSVHLGVYCAALIALNAALAAVLGRRVGRLELLSNSDPLTGLFNRRFMARHLGEDLRRQGTTHHSTSLLFIDLDRLKRVNDALGHPAGDEAIKQVASSIRACLRSTDVAGRIGGDEFSVILTRTSLDEALVVARRIAAHLERAAHERPPHTSVSIGVAVAHTTSPALAGDLVAAADRAMLEAKRAGGHRIRVGELSPALLLHAPTARE